jgi:hypothetical protein
MLMLLALAFRSQVNIMVDSAQLVSDWHDALETNQNTRQFGEVGKDGTW